MANFIILKTLNVNPVLAYFDIQSTRYRAATISSLAELYVQASRKSKPCKRQTHPHSLALNSAFDDYQPAQGHGDDLC